MKGIDRISLSARSGAVLLEVIVAITVLATAGVAAASFARQATLSVQAARVREGEMRSADAFLNAAALWTRRDLDLRLGTREQGRWLMRIERTSMDIYMVTLTDSVGLELLRTALFRPLQPSRNSTPP